MKRARCLAASIFLGACGLSLGCAGVKPGVTSGSAGSGNSTGLGGFGGSVTPPMPCQGTCDDFKPPTMILGGAQDPVIPPDLLPGGERYADDLTVRVVPSAGHFLHEECPEVVAESLRALQAQVGRSAGSA